MANVDPNLYEGEPLPLVEHLREFRNRFIVALIAVVVATALCMPFADRILQLLVSPLENKPLALNPTATFVQYIKVAFVGGIALSMPVILYQIIAFLLPALTPREKRYLFLFLPGGTLFFIGGLVFGGLVVAPATLNFLQGFGTSYAEIQYRLDDYTSFITTLLLGLGLGFQTPLVVFFLAKMGIVSYPFLVRNIRWAFLVTTILAAVLTPTPDPWTMLVVMVPLFLLYLLGVFMARFA
jgi:sec-independent protein translocase protein TatC